MSESKIKNAVRVAKATHGGITVVEYLDMPFAKRQIIIEEVNRMIDEENKSGQ